MNISIPKSIPEKIQMAYSAKVWLNIVSCSAPQIVSEEYATYNVIDVLFRSGRAHRWVEMFGDWLFVATICEDGIVEVLW